LQSAASLFFGGFVRFRFSICSKLDFQLFSTSALAFASAVVWLLHQLIHAFAFASAASLAFQWLRLQLSASANGFRGFDVRFRHIPVKFSSASASTHFSIRCSFNLIVLHRFRGNRFGSFGLRLSALALQLVYLSAVSSAGALCVVALSVALRIRFHFSIRGRFIFSFWRQLSLSRLQLGLTGDIWFAFSADSASAQLGIRS
jgi:hypothetical protein